MLNAAFIMELMYPHVSIDRDAVSAFCQRHHITRLALFGSVLRDDFGPDSDVDVLVEFQPRIHRPRLTATGGCPREAGTRRRRVPVIRVRLLTPSESPAVGLGAKID